MHPALHDNKSSRNFKEINKNLAWVNVAAAISFRDDMRIFLYVVSERAPLVNIVYRNKWLGNTYNFRYSAYTVEPPKADVPNSGHAMNSGQNVEPQM